MKSLMCVLFLGSVAMAQDAWITCAGQDGPGKGKHVVLISGDEEYRSEEALPQLVTLLGQDQHAAFTLDSGG